MVSNNIWLEIRKDNGAILSYFLEKPEGPSATVDYVQATKAELLYLNLLEDNVLPAGMVATLSDLVSHRERLAATKSKSLAQRTGLHKKPPRNSSQNVIATTSNKQYTTKKLTKAEFMAGFKKVDRSRKQGE